jgi:hypothetical protein
MTKVCPFSERSLKYWLIDYKKFGIDELENNFYPFPKFSCRESTFFKYVDSCKKHKVQEGIKMKKKNPSLSGLAKH